MTDSKQLRISEIKENVFIIEGLLWVGLDANGNRPSNNISQAYFSLEDAKDAAMEFLEYPKFSMYLDKKFKIEPGKPEDTGDNLDNPI